MMSDFRSSHAVVVGIDDYQNGIPPLRTAVNDARRLAEILEQDDHGYTIHRLFDADATRPGLEAFFTSTLKAQVGQDDRVLIYFAGHGIALDGDDGPAGYLVPHDARPEDRSSFLPMTDLHAWLAGLPCRHLLLILDCCFAGAFRWTSTRNLLPVPDVVHQERYERFLRDPAWQVITSAAYDQRALDQLAGDAKRGILADQAGGRDHSPFAQALFAALAGAGDLVPKGQGDGVITATELYLYLRDAVEVQAEEQAHHRQTPGLWPLKKHDKGEYIFLVPGHKLNLPPAPELTAGNNPWRGLESYDEKHGPLFFGREEEITELAGLVAAQPFTAVLGASGTGKSSLVKAGLVPRLRHDSQEAGTPWLILPPLRPTASPLQALHSLLAEHLTAIPIADLHGNAAALANLLTAWWAYHRRRKLLLVVDQLEELVTLCRNDAERQQFLALLARAAEQHPDAFRLVITLRTDFEPQFAHDTPLAESWAMPGARYIVPPMDHDDLRQAIEGPASARVLYFEPYELVDELADEVIQTPGALPLLSFTLSELYVKYLGRQEQARRAGGTVERSLTEADYRDLGGVIGSLRSRATEEYDALPDDAHRETMRQVMLRLVAVEGGELARRRAARSELVYPDDAENGRVDEVIRRLVAARLVVEGREEGGEAYVEPAHDALVRAWDKLLAWKAEAEEYLPLQRRLAQAAAEWEAADEKARAGLLWDGDPRLPQVENLVWPVAHGRKRWAARLKHAVLPDVKHMRNTAWLNRREVLFAQQSVARRARTLRRFAAVTLAVMVALSLLAFAAVLQRNAAVASEGKALSSEATAVAEADQRATAEADAVAEAENARRAQATAEAERDRAERNLAGQLVSLSDVAMERNLPQQSLLLSVEAASVHSPTVPAAYGALHSGLDSSGGIDLRGHEDGVTAVTFSPDGRWLATGSNDDTARLWDVQDPTAQPAVLRGHEDLVSAVAFSPDGRWLATGSWDGTARLWDVQNPTAQPAVLMVSSYGSWVHDVAFSPDGRWLATGGEDGAARLWDMQDLAAPPAVLSGDEHGIEAVVFSHDGRWLATGSNDAITRLWDVQNPTAAPAVLVAHEGYDIALAFSPDDRWLATGGSYDGTLWLWDVQNPAAQPVVRSGHEKAVSAVAFSPAPPNDGTGGGWLATASDDNTVRLWSLQDPAAQPTVLRPEYLVENADIPSVQAVAFSPDGRWLATASSDRNTAELWNLADPFLEPVVLSGHESGVHELAFSPDGRWLATASHDNTARLWNVEDPTAEPTALRGHSNFVTTMAFSPDGRWLATGGAGNDGNAGLWNMADPAAQPTTLGGHKGGVYAAAFSPAPPDGGTGSRWLATGSWDATTYLWDVLDPAAQPTVLRGVEGAVFDIAFSPAPPNGGTGSRWLATGNGDGTARLWDMQDLTAEPIVLRGHEDDITALAFSPAPPDGGTGGRWLATASFDATVRLWDVQNPAAEPIVLRGQEKWLNAVAFSPDGRWLAAAGYQTARLWDMQDLTAEPIVLRGHEGDITALAFSPAPPNGGTGGRWLATASYDGTARLWDMSDPGAAPKVLSHEDGVGAAAFSPDVRWLATGAGTAADLWDVEDPTAEPAVLRGHRGQIRAVAFSPAPPDGGTGGRWLATGSEDATVRLWTMPVDLLIEKACRVAGRNLTQQEWATYFQSQPYRCTCPDLPPGAGAPQDACQGNR